LINFINRAYALLFASRGAKVVVNDLGTSTTGSGSSTKAADLVVDEIIQSGGEAIANYNSVEDGDKIVKAAIDKWGRVDIVINNAGILRDVSFAKMKDQDWDLVCSVHLKGAYKVTKAAWPYMIKQNYGRIIMTASAAGLYGNFGQANYSAAKLALLGFGSTLSKEGARKNIYCNTIAPLAGSRMTETVMPEDLVKALKPSYVAPLVAYLCSDQSQVNGQIFEVGAGWVAKLRWQRAKGIFFPVDKELKVEDIRDNFDAISDFSEPQYPSSLQDSVSVVTSNLGKSKKPSLETPKAPPSNDFKCSPLFEQLTERLKSEGQVICQKVGGIYQFDVSNGSAKQSWIVDLKNSPGSIRIGKGKCDVNLTTSDEDLYSILTGKTNPFELFAAGKLNVSGDMTLALKYSCNSI